MTDGVYRASEQGYSWAVAILPYIEQKDIYDRIDPDWKGSPFMYYFTINHGIIPAGADVISAWTKRLRRGRGERFIGVA